MTECRCFFCNRLLFFYDFKGQFSIVVKCKGCLKTNVLNFATVSATTSSLTVTIGHIGQSEYAHTGS